MTEISPTLESRIDPGQAARALVADNQPREALDVVVRALRDPGRGDRAGLLALQARILFTNLSRRREGLEVLEAAYRQYRDDRTALTLARFRYASGKASAAFNLYKRVYRAGDPTGEAALGMFTALMEAGRYAAAARLAPVVSAVTPLPAARAHELAKLCIARRDVDGALAMIEAARDGTPSGSLAQLQTVALRLRAELAAPDAMQGRRHLAIGGAAFCGSTTLGVILGSMPGFAFAGETHWLTNARSAGGGFGPIQTVPVIRWPIACRVCERDCEHFDIRFRLALAADNTGWYAKIADRLGVRNIVTSDKNTQVYEEHDPLSRFDHILSYKTPESYLRSLLKQRLRGSEANEPPPASWVDEGLNRWADIYMRQLKSVRPRGRRVVLDWDAFVKNADFHLRGLAKALDIPLDPDVLTHIRLGHFIGGNTGVDVEALRVEPVLRLRPTNAPALSAELRNLVINHQASARVNRILETAYRRDFGGGAAA